MSPTRKSNQKAPNAPSAAVTRLAPAGACCGSGRGTGLHHVTVHPCRHGGEQCGNGSENGDENEDCEIRAGPMDSETFT